MYNEQTPLNCIDFPVMSADISASWSSLAALNRSYCQFAIMH